MPLQPEIKRLIRLLQKEQDPGRLLDLSQELNRLLEEELRLTRAAQVLRHLPLDPDR